MVLFSLDFFLFSKSFQNIWFYSKDHISWYEKTILVENMQRSKLCVIPGRVHRTGKLIRMISFSFLLHVQHDWKDQLIVLASKKQQQQKKKPQTNEEKNSFQLWPSFKSNRYLSLP